MVKNKDKFISVGVIHLIFILSVLLLSISSCNHNRHIFFKDSELLKGKSQPRKKPIYVNSHAQLIKAIEMKSEKIYLVDDAVIDFTNKPTLVISNDIELISSYDKDKATSKGAILFSNSLKTYPLLLIKNCNVLLEGLRIYGPDTLRRTSQMKELRKEGKYYSLPNSRGIQVEHGSLNIRSTELKGWSHAAIFFSEHSKGIVEKCNIHHNQRHGLGYGVCLDKAKVKIRNNYFDWNRHSIAGTGRPGTSYYAHNNIVGENASSHAFDMHGGRDRKDGTDIAGSTIIIEQNEFRLKAHEAFYLRGIPTDTLIVKDNTFINQSAKTAIRLPSSLQQ